MKKTIIISLTLLAAAVAASAQDIIGSTRSYIAIEADTLPDLAREYSLGYVELIAANPKIDPWLPQAGTTIVLPTAHILPSAPRRGIVVNLADQRLYFFAPGLAPESYPIGVPTAGAGLQTGTTRVISKRIDPTWIPPASVRAEEPELPSTVPPGPDNPLGSFALDLEWASVVIHGTNRPYGIGRRVSHGCFRLYPEDIEALFKKVPIGTPVTVVNQPVKLGWVEESLLLEVHPTLEEADELEATGAFAPSTLKDLDRLVLEAAAPLPELIDWAMVDRIAFERRGIPTAIFRTGSISSNDRK